MAQFHAENHELQFHVQEIKEEYMACEEHVTKLQEENKSLKQQLEAATGRLSKANAKQDSLSLLDLDIEPYTGDDITLLIDFKTTNPKQPS